MSPSVSHANTSVAIDVGIEPALVDIGARIIDCLLENTSRASEMLLCLFTVAALLQFSSELLSRQPCVVHQQSIVREDLQPAVGRFDRFAPFMLPGLHLIPMIVRVWTSALQFATLF